MIRKSLILFFSISCITQILSAQENLPAKEAAMTNSLDLMVKVFDIVETVKDEATAKTAAESIKNLLPEAKKIKAEGLNVGMDKLSQEEKIALSKKFKDRTEQIQKRLFGVLKVLQKTPILLNEVKKVNELLAQ